MKRRLLTATAIAAAAALALTACGSTQAATDASPSAAKITVTDAQGTKVTLDGPAKKVVGTEWNVVEDLETLGVAPAGVADVKGYSQWDSKVPLTGDPKDIGTRGEPSTDTIASIAPDLIVATTDLKDSVVAQLRKIAPTIPALCNPPDARIEQGMAFRSASGKAMTRWFSGWSTGVPSSSRKTPSRSPTAPALRKPGRLSVTVCVAASSERSERSPQETRAILALLARRIASARP